MARIFLSVVVVVLASLAWGSSASAETVVVESGNLYFCDPSFQNGVCDTAITAGDTVTWDNVENIHTVTQCSEGFADCPLSGGFDSGFLSPGDTFSVTFDTPGTFFYWCDLHPIEMRGRVLVQAQEAATPTPAATAEPTETAAGETPVPTAGVTATPGSVPASGGSPGHSDVAWPLILGLGMIGMVVGMLGVATAAARR